jgi:hypothetical protein
MESYVFSGGFGKLIHFPLLNTTAVILTHRGMPVIIVLHLLYVNRTDAIYQFTQRCPLADPDHDQTICRNPSILHA